MKVAIFGLGHVGLVTAAVLADRGHDVWGVDVDPAVLECVARGRAPFYEPDLERLLQAALRGQRLHVTADAAQAVAETALSLVCVGTPQGADGVDLSAVERVLDAIGAALRDHGAYHVVVMRSTLPPPAWPALQERLEAASGRLVGWDLGFGANPEFLREGQAIADFESPPWVLIGHEDARTGHMIAALYRDDPHLHLIATTPQTALLVKYVCNTWHALKVVFANEIGALSAHLGLDGDEVMGIFTQDEHLNLSAAYLRPGGPYGGPCLPKDVAALTELARPVGTPLLNAIAWSNRAQLQQLIERALATGGQRYGVLGLSFKAGTSDLRASPAREIIAALQAEGREVRVYDPDVPPGLAGEYAPLLQAWDEIATWAETWVVCKPQLARRHVLHGEVVGWTPSTYAGCV